jgi:predicted DnaQ family exonuclease/DinG family helicase
MPRLFELLPNNAEKHLREKYASKPKRNAKRGMHKKRNEKRRPQKAPHAHSAPVLPDFVAVDVETTGLDHRTNRIIEVGAVRFFGGAVADEYSSLVNPGIEVPAEITRLTGITQSQVEGAPAFEEISDRLRAFIGEYPLCGHQVEFDLNFLNEELRRQAKQQLNNPLLDSAILSRLSLTTLTGYSLGQVALSLGIELESAHRALADARASGEIVVMLAPRLSEIAPRIRHTMARFSPAGALKTMLFNSIGRKRPSPLPHDRRLPKLPKKLPEPENLKRLDEEAVRACFNAGGSLSKVMKDYVPRPSQADMAAAVARSLNTGSYCIAEAGTGVGKSLAYLAPAAQWALTNNTRLLVSSFTRNIGDQLVKRDLPVMRRLCGDGFRYSVLKGRGNYLCINRWKRLLAGQHGNLSPRERFAILPLIRWAEETQTGDIEEQNLFNRRWFSKVWNLISAESHGCEGWRCPFSGACFLQRARRAAQGSHIVVINHALFFSEICAESSFLGKIGPIIFDEAHHLEACGHQHLRVEFDTNRANRFIESLDSLLHAMQKSDAVDADYVKQIKKLKGITKRVRKSLREFLADCISWVRSTYPDMPVAYQYAYRDEPFASSPHFASLLIDIGELSDCMLALQRLWRETRAETEGLFGDILACIERTSQMKADLDYLTAANIDDHVFWVEGNAEKGWVKLSGVPLDIGELLAGIWQKHTSGVVFTSATLSILESIDFFKNKVGLNYCDRSSVRFSHFASPFMPEQVLRCAIDSGLEPDAQQYPAYVAQCLCGLLKAFEKNILVLFTSTAMLSKVYDSMRTCGDLSADAHVFAQHVSGSRQVMLEQFKRSRRAALLGTDSFWEGIDVPGGECEMVVVVRLPFMVPTHPLTQALAQRYEQRCGDSFFSYSVPEAIIKFRQGAGRLIRSSSDRGALIVLDRRIARKRYGKMFIDSLGGNFVFSDSIDDLIQKAEVFFEAQ